MMTIGPNEHTPSTQHDQTIRVTENNIVVWEWVCLYCGQVLSEYFALKGGELDA